ncbi:MAG: hypothetical protein KGR26_01985 [Cyanobacteria bacterium REEB65]|nr:hypothetical protein [Cyanobacteria bacterium REEB65]
MFKKAVLGSLLGASFVAGCGVTPSSSISSDSNAVASLDLSYEQAVVAQAANPLPEPSWKKVVSTRPMTSAELNGTYTSVVQDLVAEGQKNKGGDLMGVDVDQLSPNLTMTGNTTMTIMCAPVGMFGGIVEVRAVNGTVTTYNWGAQQTIAYMQGQQAEGTPIMDVKSIGALQDVNALLAKAKVTPFATGTDTVNLYLNEMPVRKPDMSVVWFPAYIVVPYAGQTSGTELVADATDGTIYRPKAE